MIRTVHPFGVVGSPKPSWPPRARAAVLKTGTTNRAGLEAALKAAATKKAEAAPGTGRRIGGTRALAEMLGISAPSISGWDGQIPLNRVLQVEQATGVPRHVLRPDHWTASKSEASDTNAAA